MNIHVGKQDAHIINNVVGSQTFIAAPADSPDALRILYLTASPTGDLRVDREVREVKAAVRSATNRDAVLIEHQPAVTGDDLLDGLTRFRPHVVHFSGHANNTVLVFDADSDVHTAGHQIGARAFAKALTAVDEPPRVVVLNACNSKAQLRRLVGSVPVGIGMSDRIHDVAAIAFAARLYAAIADGQSILSAFRLANTEMRIRGLPDADLPVLTHSADVNPSRLVLVPG